MFAQVEILHSFTPAVSRATQTPCFEAFHRTRLPFSAVDEVYQHNCFIARSTLLAVGLHVSVCSTKHWANKSTMLRGAPRSIVLALRVGRLSTVEEAALRTTFITGKVRQASLKSTRRWGSLATHAWCADSQPSSGAAQTISPRRFSSSKKGGALRHRRTGPTPSAWGEGGLPVTPLLYGDHEIPSNLKLAVEALRGHPVEEDDDEMGSEDSTESEDGGDEDLLSDVETLSEEELGVIESLLDIPAITGTEVEVISWADGTPISKRLLEPSVFGVPLRRDVIHDVIRWQLARRRSGNAKTKRIAEVSGSGRKVRPQKGGGIARAGHSRPPHWRGGVKAHGPRQRDFSFKLNKKFIKLGLRVALSARLREGELTVVDDLTSESFGTSAMVDTLAARGITGNVTFVGGKNLQPEFVRSTTNIIGIKVLGARAANVHDIIKRPSLVLTEDAVTHLEQLLEPQ